MKWKQVSRFGMKLALGRNKQPTKLISLDVGSLSTGVAISCPQLKKAYLLKVIKCETNTPTFTRKIRSLIYNQRDVAGIIIGKPFLTETKEKIHLIIESLVQSMENSASSRQFLYCFQDEDYTTMEAKAKIQQVKEAIRHHGHLHDQKDLEDGIAAMKIMERYLAYFNNQGQ